MTPRARRIALATAIGLIYVLTGKIGLDFAFLHASATPVWPPAGIALATFLILGLRIWPVIFVGAFLINISTAGSVATTFAIALGNTLEGVLGAALVTRFAGGRNALDRVRHIFLFVVLAAVLSTTVSATIGVTSLALAGFAPWSDYGSIWLTWWLGDAAGDLIVAPLILLWSRQPSPAALRARWAEALLLSATVIGMGYVVFGGILPASMRNLPMAFLCIPPLLWTALRFGQREAATAIALLGVIAVAGTARGVGPFAVGAANESLLLLQAFLATLAVTMLPVGAGVMHQRRAESAVRESEKGLRLAVAAGEMGTWDWSVATGRVVWSPELEVIHGLAPGAFPGTIAAALADIHPEDCAHVERAIGESLQRGTHRLEYRVVRPDGEIRWVEGRGEVSYDEAGRPRAPAWDLHGHHLAQVRRGGAGAAAGAGARGPRACGGRGAAPGLHGGDRPVDLRLAGRHHRAPAHRRRRAGALPQRQRLHLPARGRHPSAAVSRGPLARDLPDAAHPARREHRRRGHADRQAHPERGLRLRPEGAGLPFRPRAADRHGLS